MNILEALLREDAVRQYAGNPEAMQEAFDNIDDFLEDGGSGNVISLHDPGREDAWAEMMGDA